MAVNSVNTFDQFACLGFAERLAKHTERVASGCLEWTGTTNQDGYGRLSFEGRQYSAHRVAWMLANGVNQLPPTNVLHTCDNPPCCEGAHLFTGDQRVNMADAKTKGRVVPRSRPDGKCKRGHQAESGKKCRECHREHVREYRKRQRA